MTERRREHDDLRRQMSEADAEIVRALERRARLARQLAKARGGGAPWAVALESEPIEALVATASEDIPAAAVRSVLREVHAATAPLEAPVKVAYPGQSGDWGHVAALQQFGSTGQLVRFDDSSSAVEAVARRRADVAVIPYESSVEGTIYESVLVLLSADLALVAKVEISGMLSLMGSPPVPSSPKRIHCSASTRLAAGRFLSAQSLSEVEVIDSPSPAAAAQAARDDPEAAAILPEAYGRTAGLVDIETNIGDRADLSFRYAIVAHRPAPRTGVDSTALVFGIRDEPGALFEVLKHFAERGVSLCTIQSRPAPGERWTNLFYVEVSGHATDRAVVMALEAIKRQARFLKVLGSFPT